MLPQFHRQPTEFCRGSRHKALIQAETGQIYSLKPQWQFLGGRIRASPRLEFRLQAARGIHHVLPRKRGTPNETPAYFGGSVRMHPFLGAPASRRQMKLPVRYVGRRGSNEP